MGIWNRVREAFSERANISRIVVPNDFEAESIVPFKTQINYYKSRAQIKLPVDAKHVAVVGEDIILKAADPEVEQAINQYKEVYDLYRKIYDAELMAAICGNQLIEKVGDDLVLVDMQTIESIKFKELEDGTSDGTIDGYVQKLDNGEEKLLPKMKFLHLPYTQINKGEWAISQCYPLMVSRTVRTDSGNTYSTKCMADIIVQVEDAMGGIFANMANPDKYITFQDANRTFIEDQARQYARRKPGMAIIGDRKPDVEIIETNPQGKYDSYIKHLDEVIMMATGYSYEIFLGRFTSRASSETTESELTKMIQARKRFLCNWIKKEILEPYILRKFPKMTQIDLVKAGIEVTFKDPNSVVMHPADIEAATWLSTDEKRKWARDSTALQLKKDDPETPSDVATAERLLKKEGYTVYRRKRD